MKGIGYFISSVLAACCIFFSTDLQAQERKLKIKAKGYHPSEIMGVQHREPVRAHSYSGHRTGYTKAAHHTKKRSVAHSRKKHSSAYRGSFASNKHRSAVSRNRSASYNRNTMAYHAGHRTDLTKWKKVKMKRKNGEWEYKYKR